MVPTLSLTFHIKKIPPRKTKRNIYPWVKRNAVLPQAGIVMTTEGKILGL